MSRRERLAGGQEARRVLAAGTYGVLALVTPEGAPYCVPLNYVYLPEEDAIVFHCAKTGEKLRCIAAYPEGCFTVVGEARVIPERFTAAYESAVFTGGLSFVEEEPEKRRLLTRLAERFSPGEPRLEEVVEKCLRSVCICRLSIRTASAKRNRGE